VWFTQAEAQFFLASNSSEKTKFCHVISQLDQRYAAELEDIVTSPPERHPNTTLRTELMRRLSPSREQRIRQLLALEMGDSKPSQFLRHLRNLAPDLPENFLHSIWTSRLAPSVHAILAGQPEGRLDATARCADLISTPDSTSLLQRQVAALSIGGTIADTEPGRKSVLSSAPTASRGNQRRKHQRRHMSLLQQQAAFSSLAGLVHGSSWSTRIPTSAATLAGSTREVGSGSTTTSVQLTALLSIPTDGCLSASTWVYAGISHGGSWWQTSHIP
jgi:hypothetical protein